MTIALFIFYCILFSWLLSKLPFARKSELGTALIVSLYLIKVVAGVVYGYMHATAPQHVGLTDTWKFFEQGVDATQAMKNDPMSFFRDLLPKEVHHGFRGLFSTDDSYWNDIKHELMVKLASVLNLFSFSNYYVNLTWYNFIVMIGPIALYRAVSRYFRNRWIPVTTVFLMPSALFWGSGFHKEGLAFASLAFIFYVLSKICRKEKLGISHYIGSLISLAGLLLLRNNLLLPLAPALCGFFITVFVPSRSLIVYPITVFVCIVLFFLSPYLGISLPQEVSQRQQEFIALGGRTAVEVSPLEPNLNGFLHHLPSAINIGLLKPYLLEGGIRYLPFTLEIWLMASLVFLSIRKRRKDSEASPRSLILYMMCMSLLAFLMIGYTVPNIGAVVRYKSVMIPFIFTAIALILNPPIFKLK